MVTAHDVIMKRVFEISIDAVRAEEAMAICFVFAEEHLAFELAMQEIFAQATMPRRAAYSPTRSIFGPCCAEGRQDQVLRNQQLRQEVKRG